MAKAIWGKSEKIQNAKVPQNEESKSKKNTFIYGLLTVITSLAVIIVVFWGVFYLVVHNNLYNIAERYRKEIQAIPVMRMALPEKPDSEDPELFTESELKEKYKELINVRDDLKKQLEQANAQITELKKAEEQLNKMIEERQKIIEQRAQLENDRKQLEEDKKSIDRLIAEGDKEGFKKYFENIDKATAESLYSEILKIEKVDKNAKEFAKVYESMDPAAAARIFEQMGDSKIDLVTGVLKDMKRDISAEILEEMTPVFASKVTEKLSELYKSQ
jgi:flagellar motility protein MotE (MotC chaperone)